MNANELADELKKGASWSPDWNVLEQTATMLRQQQAEIDTYRLQNSSQIDTHRYKPVAWIDYLEHSDVYNLNVSGRGIPLYTHPAKTLTDEEIANTWDDVRKGATLKPSMKDVQDFAKAILRKAQEK